MTKKDIINQLKSEYPTLTKGINDEIVELDEQEYESLIAQWADARLAKQAQALEAEAKAEAKAALLERLGITEDEAKLLLS